MLERINTALSEIEEREGVRILYACESGSRAWGFASRDSDYDVRFIYLRPMNWYLAVNLELKRDVIEQPICDELDVSGWDLRKALQLFRKSNPPLMEWLGSPIVYRETTDAAASLRNLADRFYSPIACGYHYLRMAQGTYRDHFKEETVPRKKYFYVLRPLLAVLWIEAGLGVVPTEFEKLTQRLLTDAALSGAIDALVRDKAAGGEMDRGPRAPIISEFIERELSRLADSAFERPPAPNPVQPLDALFQAQLRQACGPDGVFTSDAADS